MTETIKLADLTPDARNANKGTKRGADMINRSLGELGAGRSILVDKNGKIIAGNKTTEGAAAIGIAVALQRYQDAFGIKPELVN